MEEVVEVVVVVEVVSNFVVDVVIVVVVLLAVDAKTLLAFSLKIYFNYAHQ